MASGGDSDSGIAPHEEDSRPGDINAQEMPGKRRTLRQRFAKVKKFFGFKTKAKDEENVASVGLKAKSTSDVLRAQKEDDNMDDDQVQLSSNKNLSMSADSVFSTERPQVTNIGDLKDSARSMEAINSGDFTNELFKKVRRRRNDEDASDDGLPHSPLTQPTTADIIAGGLKGKEKSMSRESERSLISMSSSDNELDEDMFGTKWTAVPGSKRPTSPDVGSGSDVDLDVISSTSSLANIGAKHKIAVKQKNKRASTAFTARRQRAHSPLPASPLTQVKEESPPKDISPSSSPAPAKKGKKGTPAKSEAKKEAASKKEASAKKDANKEVITKKEPHKEKEVIIKKETTKEVVIKKETLKDDEVVVHKEPVKEVVIQKEQPKKEETKKEETKVVNERPDSVAIAKDEETPQEKVVEKDDEVEGKKEEGKVGFGGVVLRRTAKTVKEGGSPESVVKRREKFGAQDPSKRQTVTGSSDVSIFGERRMSKRASSYETRNWDDLDKRKDKSPEEEEPETGSSEFAQMFNKLRRGQSKKEPSRKEPTASQDKPKPADTKPTVVQTSDHSAKQTKSKPAAKEVKEPEKEKAKEKEELPKATKVEVEAKTEVKTEKTEAKVEAKEIKSAPSESKAEPAKTVSIEKKVVSVEKETEKEKPKAVVIDKTPASKQESVPAKTAIKATPSKSITVERSASVNIPKAGSPEKKVQISDSKAKDSSEQSENPFKRKSPLVKDRLRSQTLPEQPVTPEIIKKDESKDSSQTKPRSTSQGSESADTKLAEASPQKPSSVKALSRSFPAKSDSDSSSSNGGGGQPSWIAMARRKTKAYGDDGDKIVEEKDKKDTSNMAAKKEEDKKEEKEVMLEKASSSSSSSSNSDKENQGKANKSLIIKSQDSKKELPKKEPPKEDSKSIVRPANCGAASGNRKSKVLDMLKNFEAAS